MSEPPSHDHSREGSAERVLRDGFKTNMLSPEALQRIRRATEQEWRTVNRVSARGGWRLLATAASVAILAAGISWGVLNSTSSNAAILGAVSSVDARGLIETRLLRPDVVLAEGSNLRVGQSLEVHGDTLVTLSGGGNLRIARATAFEVKTEHAIRLDRGELYVDIPPGSRVSSAFSVVTGAGEFHHQGTQFAVAIVERQTRLRVREGRVLWRAEAGSATVDAGTEMIIDENGNATRRSISTAGRDWAWMESMSAALAIEDRPLIEFLEWFARETGRKLEMDDVAREQAATIRMRGNVRGLTITEALSAVMVTTSLRYELPEGVIRVSSTRGAKTPPS
jgi:ferric-dicitrate binding protein FerR (iron transport regulator)